MDNKVLDEAVEVACKAAYGTTSDYNRQDMRAAILASLPVLLGEPVAWTVVGPDGKTSIGGWVDMHSFGAIRQMAVVRGGHSYAFAYAPSLGEGE